MFSYKYFILIFAAFMIYLKLIAMADKLNNGTDVLKSTQKVSKITIGPKNVDIRFSSTSSTSSFYNVTSDNDLFVPYKNRATRYVITCPIENECNRRKDFQKCNCGAGREAACAENMRLDVPNCYCDRDCIELNDCCYGFNKSNISEKTTDFILYKDYLECRVDIIPGMALFSTRGYWMVARCPSTYIHRNVSARCAARTTGDIPVTDDRGVAFWNSFCALCHGVFNYEPWDVQLKVNTRQCYRVFSKDPLLNKDILTSSALEDFRKKSCEFTYLPSKNKGKKPRTCYKFAKQVEPKTICEGCQSYLRPIFVDHREFYQNVFCVDDEKWKTLFHVACILEGFPYTTKSDSPINMLTILFSVRKPKFDSNNTCMVNHQFDSTTGMCLPRKCESETCKSSIDDSIILNYQLYMHLILVSDSIIDKNESRQALSMFTTCLPAQQYNLFFKPKSALKTTTLYTVLGNYQGQGHIRSIINATFTYIVRKALSKNMLVKLKSEMQQMEWEYAMRFNSQSKQEAFKIWRVWNLSATVGKDEDLANWNNVILDWGGFTMIEKYLNRLENKDDLPKLLNFPQKCYVYISTVEFGNQTGYGNPGFMAMVNFKMQDDKNDSKQEFPNTMSNSFGNDHFIMGVLTYITLSVSCGSVAPTILVHRYLSLVSSIPGLISEQILVVIFLFNVCFMISGSVSNYETICFIMSLTTHFLILSFFTWVSIFVCHTLHNLRTIKRTKRNPFQSTSFSKTYFLIGYSVPCGIVLPSAILDVCQCTSIEIGYTNSACFPTGYPANLFVVVAPLMLCLLIHVICLAYSAWYLKKARDGMSESNLSTSRSYLGIYTRLCLISCLSWGVGVLSEALDNNVMRYLFIIISGSHGLIFSLCIVTTTTFRQSFRDKILTSSVALEQIDMNIPNDEDDESRASGKDTVQV